MGNGNKKMKSLNAQSVHMHLKTKDISIFLIIAPTAAQEWMVKKMAKRDNVPVILLLGEILRLQRIKYYR